MLDDLSEFIVLIDTWAFFFLQ